MMAGSATEYNSGGLTSSATVNARWANYYADHGNTIDDTLLDKLARAFRKCHFQAPLEPGKIFTDDTFANFRLYSNDNNIGEIEKMARKADDRFANFRLYSNDNNIGEIEKMARKADDRLGADLGKYMGRTMYKGIPWVYVDILDTADTDTYGTNPIFGVNHDQFYPVVLRGEYFRINKPMSKVGQHNVLTVYVDLSYAYLCENRRQAGFLLTEIA
jgi:hypothetical protein